MKERKSCCFHPLAKLLAAQGLAKQAQKLDFLIKSALTSDIAVEKVYYLLSTQLGKVYDPESLKALTQTIVEAFVVKHASKDRARAVEKEVLSKAPFPFSTSPLDREKLTQFLTMNYVRLNKICLNLM